MEYQRYNCETDQWENFPEFIRFNQPIWNNHGSSFQAWVIKKTPKGDRLSSEIMRKQEKNK